MCVFRLVFFVTICQKNLPPQCCFSERTTNISYIYGRTMRVELTLFLCLTLLIVVVRNSNAKRYNQCDLLKELMDKHKISDKKDAAAFTCLAYELSRYDTTYATANSYGRYFGIFILPEKDTCSFEKAGKCGITCDKFLDDDITDDLKCLQMNILKVKDSAHEDELKNCKTTVMVNKYLKDCGMSTDGEDDDENEVQDAKKPKDRTTPPRKGTTTSSKPVSDEDSEDEKPQTKATRPGKRTTTKITSTTTETPDDSSDESTTTRRSNRRTQATRRRAQTTTTTTTEAPEDEDDVSEEKVPARPQKPKSRTTTKTTVAPSSQEDSDEVVPAPAVRKPAKKRPIVVADPPSRSQGRRTKPVVDDEEEGSVEVPNKNQKSVARKPVKGAQRKANIDEDASEEDNKPRPFKPRQQKVERNKPSRNSVTKPKQDKEDQNDESLEER